MASISIHLLNNDLSLWKDIYDNYPGEIEAFGRWMNKRYMFKDEELLKHDDPKKAYKLILEKHVRKI
jgi:hypothetical protein